MNLTHTEYEILKYRKYVIYVWQIEIFMLELEIFMLELFEGGSEILRFGYFSFNKEL